MSSNPFESALADVIKALSALKPPKPISSYPLVSDFLSIGEHFADVVKIMDAYAETIGFQVEQNAYRKVDQRSFCGVFSGAAADPLFEIEECAEDLREGRRAA